MKCISHVHPKTSKDEADGAYLSIDLVLSFSDEEISWTDTGIDINTIPKHPTLASESPR